MKFDLKRSLFLSIAALGFIAVAGTTNAQNASAKTYAHVTSNQKMSTLAQNRNVNFTGTHALYTKAGTLKGARKVASQSTLMGLANSNVSTSNVRAYQVQPPTGDRFTSKSLPSMVSIVAGFMAVRAYQALVVG